jgi:hypothetical protein
MAVKLRCHEKEHTFRPPGVTDVDLVPGSISSSNPSVATGYGGRVGGGTDGAISIDAQGVTGTATITYQVVDRSNPHNVTTIKVEVEVKCPPTGTPTHRTPACPACRAAADKLNKAIDELSKAQARKAGDDTLDRLWEKIYKLTKELDDCEKAKCAKGGAGGPPAGR